MGCGRCGCGHCLRGVVNVYGRGLEGDKCMFAFYCCSLSIYLPLPPPPVQYESSVGYAYVWVYFMSVIFLGSVVILNLWTGVLTM